MNTSETIWNEYRQKLLTFIKSRVADDSAEDLLQDVFIKIHTGLDSLKEQSRLESWLYQITRNAIIDYYRSSQTLEQLPDWLKQPEPEQDKLIKQELALCLEPMINDLPEKYRKAIQFSEIENKTQKQLAESENILLSGAKSRVQRGRLLLKDRLQQCCDIELNKHNHLLSYNKINKQCKYC